MAKKFEAIHPLAMAKALDEINNRAGAVIMTAQTIHNIAGHMDAAKLREAIGTIYNETEKLRAALWPEEEF
jgi:hypothetical protein